MVVKQRQRQLSLRKMTVAERESLEQQVRESEDQLRNPDELAIGKELEGSSRMKSSIKKKRLALQRDEALIPKGAAKDRIYKEIKEIEEEITEHMPSQNEMWRPLGTHESQKAVQKNIRFHALFDHKLKRLQDLKRRLEPDDPEAGNLERIRPK